MFDYLKSIMEAAGFQFEMEQKSHMQNRGWELKFIHPDLVGKLKEDGHKVWGKKFYIKRLSDEPNSEIGLVNGKKTQLVIFIPSNSMDLFDDSPAWVNTADNKALDNLLSSIKKYLNHTGKEASQG